MENGEPMIKYAYYSIAFFSLIIISLYLYIIIERVKQKYDSAKKDKYSQEIIHYIDEAIRGIMDGQELEDIKIQKLKEFTFDNVKRVIIIERFLYYFQNFKGDFYSGMTKLCEDLNLIEYEIDILKSKDLHKKALACMQLGEMRSKKPLAYLLREVNSRFTDIRYNALLALAKIGEADAFIEAFKHLDNGILLSERSLIEIVDSFEGDKKHIYENMIHLKNDTIAVVFIKSAGNFKDMFLNEEIATFLNDKNKEKKISAVKALGNMADNRFIDDMIILLEDEDWEVRAVVAKALGVFEEHRILPALIKALSDAQWFVRYNAAYSILSIDKNMESLIGIFENNDKFAKDIILSVLENTGLISKIEDYKNSDDDLKKKISFLVKSYIK